MLTVYRFFISLFHILDIITTRNFYFETERHVADIHDKIKYLEECKNFKSLKHTDISITSANLEEHLISSKINAKYLLSAKQVFRLMRVYGCIDHPSALAEIKTVINNNLNILAHQLYKELLQVNKLDDFDIYYLKLQNVIKCSEVPFIECDCSLRAKTTSYRQKLINGIYDQTKGNIIYVNFK